MGQKEGTSKYLYFSPRGSRLISEMLKIVTLGSYNNVKMILLSLS